MRSWFCQLLHWTFAHGTDLSLDEQLTSVNVLIDYGFEEFFAYLLSRRPSIGDALVGKHDISVHRWDELDPESWAAIEADQQKGFRNKWITDVDLKYPFIILGPDQTPHLFLHHDKLPHPHPKLAFLLDHKAESFAIVCPTISVLQRLDVYTRKLKLNWTLLTSKDGYPKYPTTSVQAPHKNELRLSSSRSSLPVQPFTPTIVDATVHWLDLNYLPALTDWRLLAHEMYLAQQLQPFQNLLSPTKDAPKFDANQLQSSRDCRVQQDMANNKGERPAKPVAGEARQSQDAAKEESVNDEDIRDKGVPKGFPQTADDADEDVHIDQLEERAQEVTDKLPRNAVSETVSQPAGEQLGVSELIVKMRVGSLLTYWGLAGTHLLEVEDTARLDVSCDCDGLLSSEECFFVGVPSNLSHAHDRFLRVTIFRDEQHAARQLALLVDRRGPCQVSEESEWFHSNAGKVLASWKRLCSQTSWCSKLPSGANLSNWIQLHYQLNLRRAAGEATPYLLDKIFYPIKSVLHHYVDTSAVIGAAPSIAEGVSANLKPKALTLPPQMRIPDLRINVAHSLLSNQPFEALEEKSNAKHFMHAEEPLTHRIAQELTDLPSAPISQSMRSPFKTPIWMTQSKTPARINVKPPATFTQPTLKRSRAEAELLDTCQLHQSERLPNFRHLVHTNTPGQRYWLRSKIPSHVRCTTSTTGQCVLTFQPITNKGRRIDRS